VTGDGWTLILLTKSLTHSVTSFLQSKMQCYVRKLLLKYHSIDSMRYVVTWCCITCFLQWSKSEWMS